MPLVSAKAMSLTLLELWSLVQHEQHKWGGYILITGMLLLSVSRLSWLAAAALLMLADVSIAACV